MVAVRTSDQQRAGRRIITQRVELLLVQQRSVIVTTELALSPADVEPLAAGHGFHDQFHEQPALITTLETKLATEVTELTEVATANLEATGPETLVLVERVGTKLLGPLHGQITPKRRSGSELLALELIPERSTESLEILGTEYRSVNRECRVLEEQVKS